MTENEQPILLTAAQVAALCQIPRSTVYHLARAGVIPSLTIGKAVRFRRESIEQWLQNVERGRNPFSHEEFPVKLVEVL